MLLAAGILKILAMILAFYILMYTVYHKPGLFVSAKRVRFGLFITPDKSLFHRMSEKLHIVK